MVSKEGFGCGKKAVRLAAYTSAREETFELTEEIGKIEAEIDERVRTLYGVR